MGYDREYEEKHPSFGLVQFSRVQGGGKKTLFGSAMRDHGTTIFLRIRNAVRKHSLSKDWFFSEGRLPLIEIEMSAAQFTELLTTMNINDGVPCTIRHFNGKDVAKPPRFDTEAEKVKNDFKTDTEQFREEVKNKIIELEAKLDKVPKKLREEISGLLYKINMELESNQPFVVDQFERATERIVTAAKAEVDAFVTHAVTTTGLKELQRIQEHKLLDGVEHEDEP